MATQLTGAQAAAYAGVLEELVEAGLVTPEMVDYWLAPDDPRRQLLDEGLFDGLRDPRERCDWCGSSVRADSLVHIDRMPEGADLAPGMSAELCVDCADDVARLMDKVSD